MRFFSFLGLSVFLLLCQAPAEAIQDEVLPFVVLKGEEGGVVTGEEWKSSDLKGKTNLLLYVDPGKKKKATPLIEKIDSLNYSPETLGIHFIVNTRATSIPDFLIRTMIKKRARANKDICYVLDRNRVLVKRWDFTEDHLNILVLDPSGKIQHAYAGEITDEYMNELISIIDRSLKTPQGHEE